MVMRIAQVAPLQITVPPRKYGGTERVIANLTDKLVELGHDVTLFATADSVTSAKLVPMLDHQIFFDPSVDATAHHVAMLHEIYTQLAGEFDVIHSHLDYLTLPFTNLATTPTVLTLHGRLDKPEWNRAFQRYPNANYVSISDDQRRPLPNLNWVSTVYHGVDVDSITPSYKQGNYLCFVGRMSPEKRPDLAIEIAKRVGMKLKIAAKVDHKEEPYFKSEIEPLLDHPLIDWLGEVDEDEKLELMAGAYALLLPIDWPEPFGMVFIEAIACATPVVTCPLGAVPEILKDGVTGYTGCTVDELVDAVRKIERISREDCRAYAERRFDTRRMALDYVDAYEMVASGAMLPSARARTLRNELTGRPARPRGDFAISHGERRGRMDPPVLTPGPSRENRAKVRRQEQLFIQPEPFANDVNDIDDDPIERAAAQ